MVVLINVVSILVVLSLIVFAVFRGYKRGIIKSVIRLTMLVLSAILGYFIAKFLATNYYDNLVFKIANAIMADNNLNVDINYVESVLMLIKALLVPATFVVCFIVLDVLFLLGYLIIKKHLPKPKTKVNKGWSIAVSVLSVIIGLGIVILPINGYIGLANQGGTYINNTTLKQEYSTLFKTVNNFSNSVICTATKDLSRKTFDSLGKAEYTNINGKKYKVSTTKELLGICEIYPKLENIIHAEDNADFVEQALSALEYSGDNSILSVKIAVANVLRIAGDKWADGQEIFGLNVKEQLDALNERYFGAAKPILEDLANCTEENLVEYLAGINKLLIAVEKSEVFVDKLVAYSDKLPLETATPEELQDVVNEMSQLYDLMDNSNQSIFYDVIKITVDSFQLAGQEDPCFSYFFGVVIENLRDIKHLPSYEQELMDANQTLTDIFILLNTANPDINLRFSRILNNVVKENGIMYNTVNDSFEFNKTHDNIIMLKVTQNNKLLADSYIGGTKPSYLDNKNIYETLDKLKNMIVVGK